jgi:hypothetical protein
MLLETVHRVLKDSNHQAALAVELSLLSEGPEELGRQQRVRLHGTGILIFEC